jgi:DNA-binding Xre family transcriptional regulator
MSVKCKLRVLMAIKEVNQKELSEVTKIRANTISNYINNSYTVIKKDHLELFMKFFELNSIDELFEYKEDK